LPRGRIWTELLFDLLPVDRDRLSHQMVARLALLLLIWLSGLLAYGADGLAGDYLSNSQLLSTLFGNGLIVLFGTHMIQRSLPEAISSFRGLVDLDEGSFRRLSDRIEGLSFSFVPCLVIGLVYTLLLTDVPVEAQRVLAEGAAAHSLWGLVLVSFVYLLTGTGIWMGVSIWLTVFLISRQPLRVELSPGLMERFRGLSMLTLWFALFYFLAVSIGVAASVAGGPAVSLAEIVLSPLLLFIVIGVACVLLPFYNIHRALVGLKGRELREIEEEYDRLRLQLEEASQRGEEAGAIEAIGHLFSLQIRERRLREAPEWPADIGFVSRLVSVVLIPAVVRISVELFNRFYVR
jgi:hypothetical protein